jgi:hypothetical protein
MRPESPENHAPPLTATFVGDGPPWPRVRDLLARRGVRVAMRMIDGQPAFPNEEPSEGWREIRVAAADGMVTLRRYGDRVTFVTWGNASPALRQAANALAWAFAELSAGTIDAGQGPLDPAPFLASADLPESLKTSPGEESRLPPRGDGMV